MKRREAEAFRDAIHLQRDAADDQIAARSAAVYPTWDELVAVKYKAENPGYRFRHEQTMYKTVQPEFTFTAEWPPSVHTASLYEVIDIEHAGTADDPIPYEQGMAVEKGKYYEQYGVTYLCTRDSGAPLYHDLAALVGLYVELA